MHLTKISMGNSAPRPELDVVCEDFFTFTAKGKSYATFDDIAEAMKPLLVRGGMNPNNRPQLHQSVTEFMQMSGAATLQYSQNDRLTLMEYCTALRKWRTKYHPQPTIPAHVESMREDLQYLQLQRDLEVRAPHACMQCATRRFVCYWYPNLDDVMPGENHVKYSNHAFG